MSHILIDSSVWIGFFKGHEKAVPLLDLIDNNRICINDLILSELLPSIRHKKETELESLLLSVHKLSITIDWQQIITMQTANLASGINHVGIPDLIVAQNAILHGVPLFTFDKHFFMMGQLHGLVLFNEHH